MSHDGVRDSQLHWNDTSPSRSASQNTQELQAHDESRENHNIDDSAFLEVLPDAIEDDAHRDHHPISTKNYLPRMATQEPKLNNNDFAFLEVLPDAIKDDAHHDYHPISTNTIPSSESSDPGYVDASLTSSSTILDQGYDVAPYASSSTEAAYQGHDVASHTSSPPRPYSYSRTRTKDVQELFLQQVT